MRDVCSWKFKNRNNGVVENLANFKGSNVDFLEHLVRSVGALIGSEKGGAEGGGRRGLSGEERYFHDKGLNTGLCLLLLLPPPAELRVDQRCTAEQMTGAKQRRRHFCTFLVLIFIVTLKVLLVELSLLAPFGLSSLQNHAP